MSVVMLAGTALIYFFSFLPPSSPMLREGGVVGVVGGLALVGAAPPPSGVSGRGGRGCRRGSRSDDEQWKEKANQTSLSERVQARLTDYRKYRRT